MERPINVLHLNTLPSGGAATACIRIHKALIKTGFNSNLLILKGGNRIPETYSLVNGSSIIYKLKHAILRFLSYLPTIGKSNAYTNSLYSPFDVRDHEAFKRADIIHIHWVSKFVNLNTIFKATDKVFFITMHDMYMTTGLNHYNTDYNYEEFKKLQNKRSQKLKKALSLSPVYPVAPSRWLTKVANHSGLYERKVVTIPYCIDLEIFKPHQKKETIKKKILFVAENINDRRKGFRYLCDALSLLMHKNVELNVLGKGFEFDDDIQVNNLGFISDEFELSKIYSDSDVFVIPSLEDNLPNTVIESLACGTPVVGFNIGGIPDMVEHKVNGYISDEISSEELAKGITYCLSKNDDNSMTKEARLKAVNHYSEQQIANTYIKHYIASVNDH